MKTKSRCEKTLVYTPAVSQGVENPRYDKHLYTIAKILGDFPNLANGERSAGIECLLTDGSVRRFRWDRLITLSTG